MNPLAILAIFLALVVGIFSLSSQGGIFGGSGNGPIATGPGSGSEIRNPQPISEGSSAGAGSTAELQNRPAPGESPYKGVVHISSVQRGSTVVSEEYAVIRYGGSFFGFGTTKSNQALPVNITGWQIGTPRSSAFIPRAFTIPEIDLSERDILLPPGGEAIIVTGTPAYTRNFRENQCVGYFTESNSFTPGLSSSCPDRPGRSLLLDMKFNGACIDAIEGISSCRTPASRGPFAPAVVGQACLDFMNENFNYFGCVKNLRDRRDFLESTWRVSLKRGQKLFDPRHDRVLLRDESGLLVDEFEY